MVEMVETLAKVVGGVDSDSFEVATERQVAMEQRVAGQQRVAGKQQQQRACTSQKENFHQANGLRQFVAGQKNRASGQRSTPVHR